MFDGCSSLTNINLSNFNTNNTTNMNEIFERCKKLKRENIITKDKRILNYL
jgi:surface protein